MVVIAVLVAMIVRIQCSLFNFNVARGKLSFSSSMQLTVNRQMKKRHQFCFTSLVGSKMLFLQVDCKFRSLFVIETQNVYSPYYWRFKKVPSEEER